jgi:hypothetical protein
MGKAKHFALGKGSEHIARTLVLVSISDHHFNPPPGVTIDSYPNEGRQWDVNTPPVLSSSVLNRVNFMSIPTLIPILRMQSSLHLAGAVELGID